MRILHVIESDGGTVEFIFLLAKYSPEAEHVVFAGKRAWEALKKIQQLKPQEFPTNIKMVFWVGAYRELNPFKDLSAFLSLSKWLKGQSNYDALHLHSSKAGFVGRLAAWMLGEKKVVYTTQAVSFIRKDISQFKKSLFILLEKWGHKLGGTVVCCSDSEKRALTEKGIQAITIPNGTEMPSRLIPPKLPIDPIQVISVGRATIQKNPVLFRQIADHFKGNPSIEFVWVGDGEMKEVLFSENIRITGWLSREKVREELANAHIYVSTASWEGMPFAVLEAMAYGKPLILSDCIGNIDLVDHESNGYIFHKDEEAVQRLSHLISNKTELVQQGERSKLIFEEKFRFDHIAKEFLTLYSSLKTHSTKRNLTHV